MSWEEGYQFSCGVETFELDGKKVAIRFHWLNVTDPVMILSRITPCYCEIPRYAPPNWLIGISGYHWWSFISQSSQDLFFSSRSVWVAGRALSEDEHSVRILIWLDSHHNQILGDYMAAAAGGESAVLIQVFVFRSHRNPHACPIFIAVSVSALWNILLLPHESATNTRIRASHPSVRIRDF